VDNIKIDLWENEWGGEEWIGLHQDRDSGELLYAIMKFWVP
jgi:hypothetical protein